MAWKPDAAPAPKAKAGDKLLKCLIGMLGLLIIGVFYTLGLTVYCQILQSKVKATEAPELRLQSATIYLHEVNSKYTSLEWEVKLVAVNPNTEVGISCDYSMATFYFYGCENFRIAVTRGGVPVGFLNNGTEKVVSFKVDNVWRRNDYTVTKTLSELRRTGTSGRLFGFEINMVYSFENQKLCAVDCRGTKQYFWEPVTFQSKGISKGRTGISSLQLS